MKKKVFMATLTVAVAALIIGGSWYYYFLFKGNNFQQAIIPIQQIAEHQQTTENLITAKEIERSFFVFAWSPAKQLSPKDQELQANLEDWLLERFAPLIFKEQRQRATIHQTKMLLFWCCSKKLSYKISWLSPTNTKSFTKNLISQEISKKIAKNQGFQIFTADGPLLRSSNHVHDQASLQKATRAISKSFHQSQLYEFLNDVPMLKERVLGVDRSK